MSSSMNNLTPNDTLISIKDVANRLSLSVRAVYRLIADDSFPPPVKVGGASRWYESDLSDYLNRLKSQRQ